MSTNPDSLVGRTCHSMNLLDAACFGHMDTCQAFHWSTVHLCLLDPFFQLVLVWQSLCLPFIALVSAAIIGGGPLAASTGLPFCCLLQSRGELCKFLAVAAIDQLQESDKEQIAFGTKKSTVLPTVLCCSERFQIMHIS